MNHGGRLPPKNLYLSLPALTAAEAEALLSFVDTLQHLLYEAYGDDVFDLRNDGPDHEASDPDDGPDF